MEEELVFHPGVCERAGCSSSACLIRHLVRHDDGNFRRLCSSCVLVSHPGAFCSACLALLSSRPQDDAAACSRCGRFAAHVTCLTTTSFVCLSCAAAAQRRPFSYGAHFPCNSNNGARARWAVFDERAARVLLVAAQISHWSVARAAAEAHQVAQRRMREAALARKRCRDALDAAAALSEQRPATPVKRQAAPVDNGATKGDTRRGLFGTLQS